jgi:nicotinamidase-related amidase
MGILFVPGAEVEVPEIGFDDDVSLPAQRTAMIIVDMQNDFVKQGGSLLVPAADETVPRIRRLLVSARERGVHIAYTQDTHFEGDEEWQLWPRHVRAGSWGWEIVEELKPLPGELVCRKNRYDGFYGTWLEHFLSYVWHVEHVVIVGTVSNICVLHTAASAGLRYFHIVVPADGISALTDFDQAATLRQVSWLYRGTTVRSVDAIRFGK